MRAAQRERRNVAQLAEREPHRLRRAGRRRNRCAPHRRSSDRRRGAARRSRPRRTRWRANSRHCARCNRAAPRRTSIFICATASSQLRTGGNRPAYDWMRAAPTGSISGPMSLSTTPASACGRIAAISIAIRPPSEVPMTIDALDRQLAQQRPHVIDIRAGVIVHPVRVVLRPAAAALIRHDHAARRRDVLGERFEVAAVAREPVQAQHRRFVAHRRRSRGSRAAARRAMRKKFSVDACAMTASISGAVCRPQCHQCRGTSNPAGKKNPELVARGREADFLKGSKAR